MAEFRVIPFEPIHLDLMDEQDAQRRIGELLSQEYVHALTLHPAYTGMAGDEVIVCAGVVRYWDTRCEAWAILSRNAGPYFLQIHNAVKRFLRDQSIPRVEAVVDYNHREGHRWVEALGFIVEAPRMKAYGRLGNDCTLYAKVK